MIAWEPAFPRERSAGLPPFATEIGDTSPAQFAREIPILLAMAAVIAFLLRTFIAQAFYIPSPSMVPQLEVNDRVVVSKLAYRWHEPRRGDVVVFDCPPRAPRGCQTADATSNIVVRVLRATGQAVGVVQPSTEEYIKRIIALPGEQVEGRDGAVWVNGRRLNEPYLVSGTVTSSFDPVTVERGSLWVMGDNRNNSSDSRSFGTIAQSEVVGRAILTVWPLGRASFL